MDQSETDNSAAWTPPSTRVRRAVDVVLPVYTFCVFLRVFVNCLSEMCHMFGSVGAGNSLWALFLVVGLTVLCSSMTEAKKLTEATEENCEGNPVH